MSRPKSNRPEHSAGAFLGPDMLVPAPIRTLSDDYRDEPTEPEDSDRVPEPEPPGLVRRVLDKLARPAADPLTTRPSGERDPERTHPFQETNDAGMGPAASGPGSYQGDQARMLGVTTAFLRGTRCAMPGCGRERRDPISTLADD